MHVVVRIAGSEYEVTLDVADPNVTAGDLAAALGLGSDLGVVVDGRPIGAAVPLAELGLGNGSVIEFAEGSGSGRAGVVLEVVGTREVQRAVIRGPLTIGSAPADVVVDGVAGRVTVVPESSGSFTVRDPAGLIEGPSGPGTDQAAASSLLRIAGRSFVLRKSAGPMGSRFGTFNRPPRQVLLRRPTELVLPEPPQEPARPMRFGWGALVVPLLLGLGMAILIHPRMAVFALFSPAMLLANWMEDRRRVRRERRELGEVFDEALERFRADVELAHRRDTQQRRDGVTAPADLAALTEGAAERLWERRVDHGDFLTLPLGTGCLPWEPALSGSSSPQTSAVLDGFAELHDVPVVVDLQPGDVVGVAGERFRVRGAVQHLIVQAAVNHGPADLSISVFTEHPSDWDWTKWLPHVADGSGRRRLAADPGEIQALVDMLPDGETPPADRHLLLIDLPDLASGPRSLIRETLRDGKRRGIAAVAVARRPLDLPSLSTTIVSLSAAGSHVRFPDGAVHQLTPWALDSRTARRIARGLARIDDPEVSTAGGSLPNVVHLSKLVGLGDDPHSALVANWRRPVQHPVAPIGAGTEGPMFIDLIADGPHALLGGTTGAGKSELLRTLVAGLAASVSPDHLTFVLIDYKGGSAFDACAGLPHTVGLVTDLDDHLAGRALICLEAELRYREQRLRDAGVGDIDAYRPPSSDPLPRLLVVVDEFAALAAELPDFMDALVGIAQRGRSLGVHLLLATQRPNGVISDNIKANTNLRIALRVQDSADSVDVVGSAEAASIPRSLPGRGLARMGPGDVASFQAALVTGSSIDSGDCSIGVTPFVFAHEQPREREARVTESEKTDLEVIVGAANAVSDTLGLAPPRRPWPEPLPATVHLGDVPPSAGQAAFATFGLADEPHRQRQVAATWAPGSGNLLLYGLPGSGTTTALGTLAVAIAAAASPDELHIHVLDFDDQSLFPLRGLPHVGSVIAGSDRERQMRLLRKLASELQHRRDSIAGDQVSDFPTVVVMIDNYGGFADSYGEPGDMAVHNLVARLVADGPGVGMLTIITAKQPGDIPTRLASLVASRLVFRLADRYDYSGLGIPPVEPPEMPGRAFESGSGREVQVAQPHPDGLAAAVVSHPAAPPTIEPWAIEVLPKQVSVAEFITAGRIERDEWFLPMGIGDSLLAPTGLVLRDGEHALITGPARSGRTTALITVARVARAAHPDIHIVAVTPRRSNLRSSGEVDRLIDADLAGELAQRPGRWLLLVDDAELVESGAAMGDLLKSGHPAGRVVAAGNADAIRALYGHWTQDLRRSRIGCALRPNLVTDGDLWQTQLPRHHGDRFPVGRGYLLADGQAELIQLGAG